MEHGLIDLAVIVGLGIFAQWVAWRVHIPSILFLLSFGFLVGPIFGVVSPDDFMGPVLIPFVSVSVALILFEGGMSLSLRDLPQVGDVVRNLVLLGAFVTFLMATVGAHLILGLKLPLALLLGAVLVVTGPTVVIPMLRQIRPIGEIGPILRWEGIVIDPVGATLAVLVFEAISVGGVQAATTAVLGVLLKTILIGAILGAVSGWILVWLLANFWIPDFLENAVTLMLVVISFTLSNLVQEESGFLTVTVMGVFLANQQKVPVDQIIEFKENLQVLLLGILFVLLAARLDFALFRQMNVLGPLFFLLFLILVVRPFSVFLSSWRSNLNWKQKAFLSWMAPRGIVAASVSAIFAIRLTERGVEGAEQLVPLTFLVIVGTIVIYGFSAQPLARWLGVGQPDPQGVLIVGGHPWAVELAKLIRTFDFEVVVADSNWRNVSRARKEGLRTWYGNILSHRSIDEIPLEGIGKLLCLTANDEVNSLCALHFSEVFGRSSVFQLPFRKSREKEPPVSRRLHGRLLFSEDLTYRALTDLFEGGSELGSEEVTEKVKLEEAPPALSGDHPLLVVSSTGKLNPVVFDQSLELRPEDRLISLSRAGKPAESSPDLKSKPTLT